MSALWMQLARHEWLIAAQLAQVHSDASHSSRLTSCQKNIM
jgi:hypothetical protein